jgi:hypothetical protein
LKNAKHRFSFTQAQRRSSPHETTQRRFSVNRRFHLIQRPSGSKISGDICINPDLTQIALAVENLMKSDNFNVLSKAF